MTPTLGFEAVEALGLKETPRTALILGTGLGSLAEEVEDARFVDYKDIPGFPLSTVESHQGRLVLGRLKGRPVMVFQGRFHRYEGYSAKEVVQPVVLASRAGCGEIIISNVSGGLGPRHKAGCLSLIQDHINLQGDTPLMGSNDESLGPRFPDLWQAYDPELRALALKAAKDLDIGLLSGVYAAVLGPNLETPAEYRMLRMLGADMVGMSTVPEAIAARHAGLKVLAFSVVTDNCQEESLGPVNVEEIIRVAGKTEPRLTSLVNEVIQRL